jgi:hypothetical protein
MKRKPWDKTIPPKPRHRAYDPITNTYSIDWVLIWIGNYPEKWIPVWAD